MSETTEGVKLAVPDEAVDALETHALDTLRLAVHGDDSGRDTADHVRAIAAPVVAAELRRLAGRYGKLANGPAGDDEEETMRNTYVMVSRALALRADELEGKR